MAHEEEQTFRVVGMDCAACARNIETGVARLDGVESSTVTFTTELLRVVGTIPPARVVARVRELGYEVEAPQEPAEMARVHGERFLRFMWRRRNTRLALFGALLVLPGLLFNELFPSLGVDNPLFDLMSVTAMLTAGFPIALSAWRSLRINRQITINLLMSIAAVGAVVIGAYSEAGLVMVLFALGEALEGFTAEKARESIRGLMAVAPNRATVMRPCVDCASHLGLEGYQGGPCPFCGLEEHMVPVEDLSVGEQVLVKPGERIPMDGYVLAGRSSVNQAPITGESRLVPKQSGDEVFAGSINGEGTLDIKVTHLAKDNTISRLIQMVQEAQSRRAPVQRFVDQFATYYTPAVVILAALVATVPPIAFGAEFWNSADNSQGWLYRGLALLVVACPCALVISTPVSIISAISNGARNGILFKGGAYIEALSRVKAVAFDKTGTLTQGAPAVISVHSVACQTEGPEMCDACDELLALASAVERRSEHPLAAAVVAESEQRGVTSRYPPADGVIAMSGQGVTGKVNGRQITVGNHDYFDTHIPHHAHCQSVTAADLVGYTTMLVSEDEDYAGFIALADKVRESSRHAIRSLQRQGITSLTMITGDNRAAAEAVAQQIGVTDVRANSLPADKVAIVTALAEQHGAVAMVGDGINDTPALATASVGIAIGNKAQAMETADISLMGDDLRQLPFAIKLSRAAMKTIRFNVALSLGIKLAFLVLVLMGLGSMWLAVFADMGTSVLVTLNGMRLLRRPRFSA